MIDLLRVGEANALTTKVLVEKSGMSSREIQLTIEAARRDGIPVLSSSNGYFIAESIEECRRWEATQESRIRAELRTLRGVRRWRKARTVEAIGLWDAA